MKKTASLLLTLALTLGLFLAGCADKTQPAAPATPDSAPASSGTGNTGEADGYTYPQMELIAVSQSAEDSAKSYYIRVFIDLVTERSGGNITFREYFNELLCKGTEQLENIKAGVADCGNLTTLYTPSNLPLNQVSYPIPFGPTDPNMIRAIMEQLSEEFPDLVEEYHNNNIEVLGWTGCEPYKAYSNIPLQSLSDLKGVKLGMAGKYYIPWYETIGTAPVATTSADVYQSVKTNVTQGFFCYDSLNVEYKWFEVMKYAFDVGMGSRNTDVIGFNLDTWNSFDEPTKELMRTCADDALDIFMEWQDNKMAEWAQAMEENGVVLSVMSDAEKEVWAAQIVGYEGDSISSWIDEVTALGYDGSAIMHRYFEIAEDLGHTWAFDTSIY